MVSHVGARSAAALFSVQTAAALFALLTTQQVLYRLFQEATRGTPKHQNLSTSKGRISILTLSGGIVAGVSMADTPRTSLYLTVGALACIILLGLHLRHRDEKTTLRTPPTRPLSLLNAPHADLNASELWERISRETNAFFRQQGPDFFVDAHTMKIPISTAVRVDDTHYLNANWMGGGLTPHRLIATQYPICHKWFLLNPALTQLEQSIDIERRRDFWKVACAHNAMIIDLCEPIEDERCCYYPTKDAVDYGEGMLVSYLNTTGAITTYSVTQGSATTTIKRHACSYWPDGDVITVAALALLVEEIQGYQSQNPTLMIHCLAGVGRTGTLIAALILKEKIDRREITSRNLHDHLAQIITTLRKQRNERMVQTQRQFNLLYVYATTLLYYHV